MSETPSERDPIEHTADSSASRPGADEVTETCEFPSGCERAGVLRYMNLPFCAQHYPVVRRNVRIAARRLLDKMDIQHGAATTDGPTTHPPVATEE